MRMTRVPAKCAALSTTTRADGPPTSRSSVEVSASEVAGFRSRVLLRPPRHPVLHSCSRIGVTHLRSFMNAAGARPFKSSRHPKQRLLALEGEVAAK